MPESEVNYLAVLVVSIIGMVIGGLWYAPFLFGKAWMRGVGKTQEEVAADYSPVKLVGAFVGCFVTGYALARILGWADISGWLDGALVGLLCGVGFLTAFNGVNYWMEHRPLKLFLVNNLHELTFITIAGAVLGAWR